MVRLLLIGNPGIGKSAIVRATLARLATVRCAGFYTEERRHQGRRIAFKIFTLDGQEGTLAVVGREPPRIGRYTVHVEEFERLVLPQMDSEANPADLYVIDEIGQMELLSQRFRTSLIDLLARPTNILATIAKKGKGFLEQLKGRNDFDLLEVTAANRDQLAGTVAQRVGRGLSALHRHEDLR
jgi:nucleoside-triphosphatase THEP1